MLLCCQRAWTMPWQSCLLHLPAQEDFIFFHPLFFYLIGLCINTYYFQRAEEESQLI